MQGQIQVSTQKLLRLRMQMRTEVGLAVRVGHVSIGVQPAFRRFNETRLFQNLSCEGGAAARPTLFSPFADGQDPHEDAAAHAAQPVAAQRCLHEDVHHDGRRLQRSD